MSEINTQFSVLKAVDSGLISFASASMRAVTTWERNSRPRRSMHMKMLKPRGIMLRAGVATL
jgi:hypothetical protein